MGTVVALLEPLVLPVLLPVPLGLTGVATALIRVEVRMLVSEFVTILSRPFDLFLLLKIATAMEANC